MTRACYMVKSPPAIGGNAAFARAMGLDGKPRVDHIILRRHAAIGDVIASTVVADRLFDLGIDVTFQCAPMIHGVLRRHPILQLIEATGGQCHVNLDGAYETDPKRKEKSFWEMFMTVAAQKLSPLGVDLGPATNCRPRLIPDENLKTMTLEKFQKHPRPWIMMCPRSESYAVRQVPDYIWGEAAKLMPGTKFWVGLHPAPEGVVDLKSRSFEMVMGWISVADILATVDTGPMHVAAAYGIPVVAIEQSSSPKLHLNDQNDFYTVFNSELNCLNCQQNVCPIKRHQPPCQIINPQTIAEAVNRRLDGVGKVSVVIPTYNAPVLRLNDAIDSVLKQCHEVIVTADAGGKFPAGAIQHSKVRYVQSVKSRLGFGKNANFGARHAVGEFILFLNDDAIMHPGSIDRMMEVMTPEVGGVAPLTKFPNGRVCAAGKTRIPGKPGFINLDWNQNKHTVREPVQQESLPGTALLLRRRAFYESGCWDEDVFAYAEDDILSLDMRYHGWRLMYQPNALCTHIQAATSIGEFGSGQLAEWNRHGIGVFNKKWGHYWEGNRNVHGMGNFEYLK